MESPWRPGVEGPLALRSGQTGHAQRFVPGLDALVSKLLFLAANPQSTERLLLDEEVRSIERVVDVERCDEQVTMTAKWAVRPGELYRHLESHRPDIVHISAHGTPSGQLILVDECGESMPTPIDAVAQVFRSFRKTIRLLVLNVCHSRALGEAISESIDNVVCMSHPISDTSARQFSETLYRALLAGSAIESAFAEGVLVLTMAGLAHADAPTLLQRRVKKKIKSGMARGLLLRDRRFGKYYS